VCHRLRHNVSIKVFFASFLFTKKKTLLLFLLLASPAAAGPHDCGTIVLPTGIGETAASDLTSFNPLFVDSAYNEEAAWTLFPNLLWINRFSQIDWSRSLASSVTTTDNTNFLITLRPWKWSDGVPLTAGDVAYYFNMAKQLGTSWPGYGAGGLPYIVKAIKILAPTQLVITTVHPVNPDWFIYNGIGGLEPLPQHVWGRYTLDQMYQQQSNPAFFSVVDGPLKIQKLEIGLDAVFVPNPTWPGGKMHFNRLVFKFLEGDGAAVQGVESGDTDAAMLTPNLMDFASKIPNTHIEVLPPIGFINVINLNFHNPAVSYFNDVRVRQAMADAIDQDTMIKLVYHGAGVAAYSGVPQSMTPFLPPAMRQGIYPVGYNPAKARALLAAAGFTPGPDGIMQKNGQRLSFTQMEASGSDNLIAMDDFIEDDLRKVGIDMKVQIRDFNQMMALMSSQPTRWEAGGTGSPAQNYPSGETDYATGAFQNLAGYSDPKMDALINASVNTPGRQNLFDYETYLSTQQPVIFFATGLPVILASNRLHGLRDFVDPVGQFAPEQLTCTAP
jgi:peptide/nickel transport system substrate-binding protein